MRIKYSALYSHITWYKVRESGLLEGLFLIMVYVGNERVKVMTVEEFVKGEL